MLRAYVLNSDATINSYERISGLEFIPGEQIRLVIQLYQSQRRDQLRYFEESLDADLTLELPNKDGSVLSKVATPFADRSIWYVELTEEETAELASGSFTFEIDVEGDGSVIKRGWVENGLAMIITGGGGC